MNMRLDNGVLAAYQQCHFTPDYWRNYTVIGTEGRLENFGDGPGDTVRVWNTGRSGYRADADIVVPRPRRRPARTAAPTRRHGRRVPAVRRGTAGSPTPRRWPRPG